jgi:hypothetical protein
MREPTRSEMVRPLCCSSCRVLGDAVPVHPVGPQCRVAIGLDVAASALDQAPRAPGESFWMENVSEPSAQHPFL